MSSSLEESSAWSSSSSTALCPGEAARQLWSKLCDHFWVLKAARRPVNESCWKLAVSGVEQVVEQLVGCVALLGLLEPVELQLSLPCRQACSDRIIIINTSLFITSFNKSLTRFLRKPSFNI